MPLDSIIDWIHIQITDVEYLTKRITGCPITGKETIEITIHRIYKLMSGRSVKS